MSVGTMLIRRLRQSGVRATGLFTLRLGVLSIRRPREAADHLTTQLALTRAPSTERPVAATLGWRRVLHEQISASWPCEVASEFQLLWTEIAANAPDLSSAATDHDADPVLAEVVWCLVRHLRPRIAVETGVSRGITSRVILEALGQNGDGHLWSIDLPPLEDPWRQLVGSAVPVTMRERWAYVRGASRRRLPEVCRRVGRIDLFVHDSLHTADNLHFELATIWPHLRPGGVVVIDDVEDCAAMDVVPRFTEVPLLVAKDERKTSSVGFVAKSLRD